VGAEAGFGAGGLFTLLGPEGFPVLLGNPAEPFPEDLPFDMFLDFGVMPTLDAFRLPHFNFYLTASLVIGG
jgi:hypothetical protein